MRKSMISNRVTAGLAVLTAVVMVTGCGKTKGTVAETELTPQIGASEEANAVDAKTDADSTNADAGFFSQGVYLNYAKDAENPPRTYFYVFNTETDGYTADGENNDMGVPFSVTQTDGKATFSFGGADSDESVLVITGNENGMIYGYFEDVPERELVFEPVPDADPEGFSAVNYLNAAAGEDLVYNDANGWSVHYNPSCIAVNGGGPLTTFVYTGDCPGTCMVSVTYDVDMDAKAKADDLAKSYGEKASVTETIFPGTEDVKGYYVDAVPGQLGPGLYESAYVRDYMDGYLMFEHTTHVAGDDAIDIPISDALAAIIDSLTFGGEAIEGEVFEGEDEIGPTDFVQVQSGRLEFKDYDDVISCLKSGQGYAKIKLEGGDEEILAMTEKLKADGTTTETVLYTMKDGAPWQMGYVTGRNDKDPVRLADGLIYAGDEKNYDVWCLTPDGTGLMMRASVYEDTSSGTATYGGFIRSSNDFNSTKDFTGDADAFAALIKERDSKPAITFTAVK